MDGATLEMLHGNLIEALYTGQLMKKMNYLQPSKIKLKKYTVN